MPKLNPRKVQSLIAKGRLVPIIQTNTEGKNVLIGYRRKNIRSSKSHEQYLFPEPVVLDKSNEQVENIKV